MSPQYGDFGPLPAEIGPVVWGTPPNLNEFRVCAALLHRILVVGVSQTLRRWAEGATYIRWASAHILVFFLSSPNLSRRRLDVYHTSTHGGP